MMKIKNHNKGVMTITGCNVLRMIQEESIAGIDLLVRESLQNSLDAAIESKENVVVDYIVGKFSSSVLASNLESLENGINKIYNDDYYNFIAIKDSNTKGLVGSHEYTPNRENNLYNLVYDMMSTNKASDSGGSWGIGKSVYYRFGIGLCFYYSRTFENGTYISKLCGALIEDESSDKRISLNNTGICFFGDLDDNNNSMPIYDEIKIKEFLKIFNIKFFEGDETGLIVIIPYINDDKFLSQFDDIDVYWKHKLEDALEISIQRWYFSRLNNPKFSNGKYLTALINHKVIELNHFFKKLQILYNKDDSKAKCVDIKSKNIDGILGTLTYRIFNKEELLNDSSVFIAPNLYFGNFDEEKSQRTSVFYMRKPGMVLSYDDKNFETIYTSNDKYLIAMFVLNDYLEHEGETLGEYFRHSEKASHASWCNAKLNDYPYFSKKKPYTKLKNEINKILNDEFGDNNIVSNNTNTNVIRKKLGKLLLPPDDFGNGASITRASHKDKKLKESKKNIEFESYANGLLNFKINLKLKKGQAVSFVTYIIANGKYSFEEWGKLGFKLPVSLNKFGILDLKLNKKIFKNSSSVDFKNIKAQNLMINSNIIMKYEPLKDSFDNYYGIKLVNECDDILETDFRLSIKALDVTYNIAVDTIFVDKVEDLCQK